MRRLLVLAMIMLCGFAIWMAGCDDGEGAATETSETTVTSSAAGTSTSESATTTSSSMSTEPASTTDTSSTGEPADTTLPVLSDYGLWEDTIKYANGDKGIDVNITVSIPEEFDDAGGMAAPKDNRLVGIYTRVDNLGGSEVKVSPGWFTMADIDGNIYESITVTGSDHQLLEPRDLQAGETVEGYVFFEVPDDAVVMSGACPVAMLFIRCAGGISHHPAEAVAARDVGAALVAVSELLFGFASQ